MIHPTALIHESVKIGNNVSIGAYCIIGFQAESLKHWGKPNNFSVVIGDNTVITGLCTIDAGTIRDTVIGSNNFIMKQTHIGHDVVTGDNVIISPHATIGGHCELGNNVNFGMNSVAHQRAVIPNNCMVGMGAVITKKTQMWENSVLVGSPAYFLKWNNQK